jgi:hypothetical protein
MKILKIMLISLLFFFGGVTVFVSTSVIFDLFGIRAKEGNYVLFVVVANFFCGILYLLAAFSTIKNNQKISTALLLLSIIILTITFLMLKIHIDKGEIYELKTVTAMTFRTIFTVMMTEISLYILKKGKHVQSN